MRYGYWLPVFGGWLRNVEDEGMEASWSYVSRLAKRSEQIGYDLTLIAELNLNDIKGVEEPALDAWSTAAALAAVTPQPDLIDAAERIVRAVGISVGGVEYMIDDRDGTARFYDINALSNFVANPLDVLGWDPHDRLVDFLERQLSERRAA